MTAFNLITCPKAAYLITDRASCSADGIVQQIEPKITVSHELNMAIATTGVTTRDSNACKRFWLDSRKSQMHALGGLALLVRELVALNGVHLETAEGAKSVGAIPNVVTLAVAFWSKDRLQPGACLVTSARGHLPDRVTPFEVRPVWRYLQPEVPAHFHPRPGAVTVPDALRLIEAQRRVPSPWGTNHIGGAADMAIVDAAGVKLQTLCDWDDELGRKIAI